MKPTLQHLDIDPTRSSLLAYRISSPIFGFHWHYHPEFELTYIHQGFGTRMVGDHVSPFEDGDMVLIGSNVPHTWMTDEAFHAEGKPVLAMGLQFAPYLIPDGWLGLAEMQSLRSLLEGSRRGLHIKGTAVPALAAIMDRLVDAEGFSRVELLLRLLHDISQYGDTQPLASPFYTMSADGRTEDRIDRVCQHLHANYAENIRLPDIAALANMTETAFCRFFKKITGRSLLTYVNDLRIGKACQLLRDTDQPISGIAYQVGYQSLTHFNRSFSRRKEMAPRQYRARHEG